MCCLSSCSYSPTQLVRVFALSDLLDKVIVTGIFLLPPCYILAFIFMAHGVRHSQFSTFYARRFH